MTIGYRFILKLINNSQNKKCFLYFPIRSYYLPEFPQKTLLK